jgi:hypothetical protein
LDFGQLGGSFDKPGLVAAESGNLLDAVVSGRGKLGIKMDPQPPSCGLRLAASKPTCDPARS